MTVTEPGCTGPSDHSVKIMIGGREVIARHTVTADPAALMPCWDYAVIGESGHVVAYIIVNEIDGRGPYDIFSASGKMRYLETRKLLPEAIGRGWLEAP